MIDYKELLLKYMCHVRDEEGVTFVRYLNPNGDKTFTAEEAKVLIQMHKDYFGEI